jgi:hypothetical protein
VPGVRERHLARAGVAGVGLPARRREARGGIGRRVATRRSAVTSMPAAAAGAGVTSPSGPGSCLAARGIHPAGL